MVVKVVVNGPGVDEMTIDLCDTEEQLEHDGVAAEEEDNRGTE